MDQGLLPVGSRRCRLQLLHGLLESRSIPAGAAPQQRRLELDVAVVPASSADRETPARMPLTSAATMAEAGSINFSGMLWLLPGLQLVSERIATNGWIFGPVRSLPDAADAIRSPEWRAA
jgi:hypothetical protein